MTCSVANCSRRTWARGLCGAHYHRWARGKPVDGALRDRGTQESRFFARVRKTDACWEWTGATMNTGYGFIRFNGKNMLAHRASWLLHAGDIGPGLFILHRCDNRRCVRPDHLFLGTHADNMRDMKAKGRAHGAPPPGARNPSAKLTDDVVVEIRARSAAGERYRDIAASLGMGADHISRIARRLIWTHIP